jgi:hypothetical protein
MAWLSGSRSAWKVIWMLEIAESASSAATVACGGGPCRRPWRPNSTTLNPVRRESTKAQTPSR